MKKIEKYLALFETKEKYTNFLVNNNDFVTPNVSVCDDTKQIFYNETQLEPFVITNTGGNSLTISLKQNTKNQNLTYKVDDGEWTTTTSITIKQNESVSIASSLEPSSTYGIGTFAIDGDSTYKISGNIMSLYGNKNSIEDTHVFSKLFSGCTQLVDASELKLPATKLESYCYYYMFGGCTRLTSAPQLSATTLESNCYREMFRGCTSLTTAPELPATILADSCYREMFYGCTNLTIAPELQATTLDVNSYSNMFYGCSKLNEITMLATNINASNCLTNWVNGVSSNGVFVKNPFMTSLPTGISGIPNDWEINYYVEKDKYPYIITTELNKTVIFNAGTSETWEATNNIVKLTDSLRDTYLKLQPIQKLTVDIYNRNSTIKNIIWDVNTTLDSLCENFQDKNKTAIFINKVEEIEEGNGSYYGYY